MIDKLLKIFFTKELPHKNKRVTLIKNREITPFNFDRTRYVPCTEKKTEIETTCLSKYFIYNRGLNVKERLSN